METTEKVANFIVNFNFNDIPAQGIEQIKFCMLDTIGCALEGSMSPVGPIITDFVEEMGGNPQARILKSGIRTSVVNAALVNGALAHADDFDDTGGFGHPGVVLIPTALALGEHLKLSGEDILEAYTIAFEVGYRLKLGVGVVGEGGFHSTSLFGNICTAAEASKLMGLDVAQTRNALGIAASMASGIQQNFGTYAKAFHAGHTARNGITAAILAKKGFTGDPEIFEARLGYVFVFGRKKSDVRLISDNIGEPLAIAEHGVKIKKWPNCAGNHEALTAIFSLIEENDIKPDEVDEIEVATTNEVPGPVIRVDPRNGFEGKFSLQYNVATALVDRKIDLASYSDEKYSRPIIQKLIRKVKHIKHPDNVPRESRYAVVTLKLKDGRSLSKKSLAKKLKTQEEIYNKYRENARVAGFGDDRISQTIKMIEDLEKIKDITDLIETVC